VTVGTDNIAATTKRIEAMGDFFAELTVGEDVVHGRDTEVKQLQGGNHAFDFKAYLDYIIMEIGIGMSVPTLPFWSGEGVTNASIEIQAKIFDGYVKFLQASMAHVINTQIIPRLVKTKETVRLVFNNSNEDEIFVKAKTDLIWLDRGVKTRNEVRSELGLVEIPGLDDNAVDGQLGDPNLTGDKSKDGDDPGADDARAETDQDVT